MIQTKRIAVVIALLGLVAMFGMLGAKPTHTAAYITAVYPTSIGSGTVGVPYSATFIATGSPSNFYWTVTGLPPGMNYQNVNYNLVISGVPTRGGHYNLNVTVTNGAALSIIVPLNINYPITPGKQ